MKTKWFIFPALALVFVAMVWFGHQRAAKHQGSALRVRLGAPPFVPSVKFLPFNSVRMVTIVRKSQTKQRLFNPAMNAWDDIHLIVDDKADIEQRIIAASRLPSRLTDADWRELKGFLLRPDSLDNEQLSQVLKNELMDKLCLMNPVPNGLGSVLSQIYQNGEQNEVVRDYALQHLATLDIEVAQNGGTAMSREEQSDQKVLWSAINEAGDSIAGTALLGLVRLSQQPKARVDEKMISTTALGLANDAAAGELTQITAYQVCAQLNLQDALPTIEAAAQSGQTIPVQISAIGALGQLGGTNDIPLLQSLLQGNGQRLQFPVQTAIQRIEARASTTSPPSSTL
jgi:hypothetical protein